MKMMILFGLFYLTSCSQEFKVIEGSSFTPGAQIPDIKISQELNTVDQTVEVGNLEKDDEVYFIQNPSADCSSGLVTSKVVATIDKISFSPGRPYSMNADDKYRVLVKKSDGKIICSDEIVTKDIFLKDVVAMANTYSGMCALQSTGKIVCWNGFLGLDTPISTLLPTYVSNIENAKKISGGWSGYCAIDGPNDSVKCWGNAVILGNGQNAPPVEIGLTDAKEIEVEEYGACAVVGNNRDLYCWGNLPGGNYTVPTFMNLSDVHQLSTASYTFCAVAGANRDLYCRSTGGTGLFGGAPTNTFTQMPLSNVHQSVWSPASTVQCVIMGADRHIQCSGHHEYGGVGNGMKTHGYTTNFDHTVNGLVNIKELYGVGYGFCAKKDNDEMMCWGWNYYTAFPIASPEKIATPIHMPEMEKFKHIHSGYQVACGILADSRVRCMGWDEYTRTIGKDLTKFRTTTIQGFETLSSYFNYQCFSDKDKNYFCQGNDRDISNNFAFQRYNFDRISVPEFQGADKVTLGPGFQCMIKAGKVSCWGENGDGQLGLGSTTPAITPQEIPGLQNIIDLKISRRTVCALSSDKELFCWGDGNAAGLGTGVQTSPVKHSLTDVTAIASEEKTGICVIADSSQSVYCLGSSSATLQTGSENSKEIKIGTLGVKCAKKTDNRLYCWGSRYNGTSSSTLMTPTLVAGVGEVSSWMILGEATCAISGDDLWCWGYNGDGLVGNSNVGIEQYSYTPVKVNLSIKATRVEKMGMSGICAFDSAQVSQCWGLMRYDWPMGNMILAPYDSSI